MGRYVSIPDIEAQLAPSNITYTHSLLYTYVPYTKNGMVSTTMLAVDARSDHIVSWNRFHAVRDSAYRK